ncbi:MAG: NADH-quinone oxidoreductase subunit G [Actinomycetia bacterium]|nr:NADH-quinone oxidoreductase subunit G [Actinomycetes bacterium]
MSTTSHEATGQDAPPVEMITATIDGTQVTVPKGTMIIRAAELMGVEVPRFCDHPLLDPVAACRACLVDVEGMPKPQPSCAVPLNDGMVVKTQVTSEIAATAQKGVMEFLLINHPLDCPVCDKGGECPLQNQAMSVGRSESRFTGAKREFPKPINVSSEILLDRERCVSCARCTRFAEQIAGDPFIALLERGAQQQVGVGEEPFDSYFSGNTIQICPVGALTSEEYRFRSRPFDLVSVPTTCEHCASGCAMRTDYRHDNVMRRQSGDDPEVNEEWNCDKGRFAFPYLSQDRITQPLIRENGQWRNASWPEALRVAADGLAAAAGRTAVLTGGRLTMEDAYAYARFARVALGTDDIDMRARPASDEEAAFLAHQVAGSCGPVYRELEDAPAVLLAALEPEEESPIIYLRLRKAVRTGTKVFAAAPFRTEGLDKMSGSLIESVPGGLAATLDGLTDDTVSQLSQPGAVILVGERAATEVGAFAALQRLAERTGAELAWVPRRAGERGALDAGCLPGLLPGGRPLTDATARAEVAELWGIDADDLPQQPGRSLAGVVAQIHDDVAAAAAHAAGTDSDDAADNDTSFTPGIGALLVAGVEPADIADADELLTALEATPFLVSLETRHSEVTSRADVVLPVAVVTEKAGAFVNWEGRRRPFGAVMPQPTSFSDAVVLSMLSDYLDLEPSPREVDALRTELGNLGAWQGDRVPAADVPAGAAATPGAGEAVLASWRQLLDLGVMQEGEPHLAGTRKPVVARISAGTAATAGVGEGDALRIATDNGAISLPVELTEMPDGVVWVPTNSLNSQVMVSLAALPGATVRLERGEK